jgi:hypothetical protein
LPAFSEEASARNDSLGVTGLPFYSSGNFMQCIEGSKESIGVIDTVCTRTRHFGLIVLEEGNISNREFANWDGCAFTG